jgi:hypothetical protein
MTHKEFYIWLEGYLTEKDNELTKPIIQKMMEVKDNDPFFPRPRIMVDPINIPTPHNPFKEDGYDDLGSPPKIVM